MPDELTEVPLDLIDERRLPLRQRVASDRLADLMRSIQRYGLIEPVVVTPFEAGYRLVVGRRRLEACRLLGMQNITAIVRRMSEDRARELSYQSNLQVEPLNLADEVDFLRRMEVFHLPDEDVGKRLGMSTEEIAVARRFGRLPAPIREAVRTGEIDERRALVISRIPGEANQTRVFRHIRENDPPIDVLEDLVDRVRMGEAPQI